MSGAEAPTFGAFRPEVAALRLLCIGNGGMVYRKGRFWTDRATGDFLCGLLDPIVETACFCAWLDTNADPLAQTVLDARCGIRPVALPSIHHRGLRAIVNACHALTVLLREVLKADFVYIFWPGRLSAVAARLCRAFGKRYGIYLRGEDSAGNSTFVKALSGASFVIVAGEQLRQLAERYCKEVDSVTPMTSLRLEHLSPPRRARTEGPWQLLYVGRIEEAKGVLDLLEALPYLRDWGIAFSLTLLGGCYDSERFRRSVPPELAGSVHLRGPVTEFDLLASFYRQADAFVFPSHEEGFPRVLYEAMTFGLPIITTFVGGISGVMADGCNCLRIQVRNPYDIALRIRDLLASEHLQEKLSRGSHECMKRLLTGWHQPHSAQVMSRLRRIFTSRLRETVQPQNTLRAPGDMPRPAA